MINKGYKRETDVRNVVAYAVGEHCQCGLFGAQGLLAGTADSMFLSIMEEKREFSKDGGRMVLHIIVSFDDCMKEYITPEVALRIGYDICTACFPGFQVVFGVHDNTEHLHIHFVVNTVSYYTGKKFSRSVSEIWRMENVMEQIVSSYKSNNYEGTIDELHDLCGQTSSNYN